MIKTLVLVLAILGAATLSRADNIYAVAGGLTITGNDACGGVCVETIAFSFELDEAYEAGGLGYFLSIVPGTAATISSGPLGNMGIYASSFFEQLPYDSGNTNIDYLPITSSFGAPLTYNEIDIWAAQSALPASFTPVIEGANLYGCSTATCLADFCPPQQRTCDVPTEGVYVPGTEASVVTLISTPEPSSLALVGLGILPLLFLGFRGRSDTRELLRNTPHP